jgi:hypothetical protein
LSTVQIEQAIFTSAKTDRAQGYQLLSRSAGLSEADARELSVWGPSHGSLLAGHTSSTNYFRLASGAHCVSRTTMAGAEYSGRGGETVYTQFLVLPAEIMARFANSPFAILRAAAASGALDVFEEVPETLPALRLAGRSPVVDLGLVAQLARDPGPAALGRLMQAALESDQLAVYSTTASEALIAGLVNLLPVECRTSFSFATGLIFSPSRPVRLSWLPAEESSWRPLARRGITLVRLERGAAADETPLAGWAAWIAEVLELGKLSVLTAELEQARPGLAVVDLNALGRDLLAGIHGPATATPDERPGRQPAQATGAPRLQKRADQAHHAAQAALAVEAPARQKHLEQLADKLAEQPPEVLELLERIDDLVFGAISGDARALAELEVLWPLAASELDAELVEQSREQYLRCALSICSDFSQADAQRPERAVSAVDVLCVLFEE